MTNLQSLRTIADEETARTILGMIRGDIDPRTVSEPTDRWVRACYHPPSAQEQALHAADVLLGTYGVEGWADDDGRDGVSYCNAGDTYARTLFLVRGRFRVSDLATIADRH